MPPGARLRGRPAAGLAAPCSCATVRPTCTRVDRAGAAPIAAPAARIIAPATAARPARAGRDTRRGRDAPPPPRGPRPSGDAPTSPDPPSLGTAVTNKPG